MTVNLYNLPPEMILHLTDPGGLEVQDGLALRQTCKTLHEVTESRLFWLSLIRNCQNMGYAMPFPPFRKVSTLSTSELIRVAVKFVLIGNNLASPEPQFRSHRVLSLGEEEPFPGIDYLAILPNGHHVLLMHYEGVFTLWDLRPTSAPGQGRLLARHKVPYKTTHMEYTTEGDNGSCIVVAALSKETELPTIFVFQFQLDFSSEGSPHGIPEVVQSDLARFRINPTGSFVRVALQEGLCFVWNDSGPREKKVTASILDYRSSKRMDLETGIMSTMPSHACIYHGNLIFHHDDLAIVVVNAYFDITQYLRSVAVDSGPGDIDTIHKAPDLSSILPLWPPDSACTAHQEPNLRWQAGRPAHLPNANTPRGSPSIFITGTVSPKHVWTRYISARWMEPQGTLNLLRTGANTVSPIFRMWIDLGCRTSAMEDGVDLWIPTTCGLRMLWVTYLEDDESEGSDDMVLFLIPVLIPNDRTRRDDGKRILRLPISFKKISLMGFSDESGTLVIGSNPDDNSEEGSEESVEQSRANPILHVLQY